MLNAVKQSFLMSLRQRIKIRCLCLSIHANHVREEVYYVGKAVHGIFPFEMNLLFDWEGLSQSQNILREEEVYSIDLFL